MKPAKHASLGASAPTKESQAASSSVPSPSFEEWTLMQMLHDSWVCAPSRAPMPTVVAICTAGHRDQNLADARRIVEDHNRTNAKKEAP